MMKISARRAARAARAAAALALAAAALAAGCLSSVGVTCPDGTLCPDGTSCASVDTITYCVTGEQRAACSAAADGTACAIAGQPVGVCHGGVCLRAGCGDGFVTGTEQCDGAAFGAIAGHAITTCGDLGYYDATDKLGCTADCRFDRGPCTGGLCGDDHVDPGEDCDGTDLGTAGGKPVTSCRDLGFYGGTGQGGAGTVTCLPTCHRDLGACAGVCGDGARQGSEACDGTDTGGATCAALHRYTGTPGCTADCKLTAGTCTGACGDGAISGPERCDGALFERDCASFGYYTGTPTCPADGTDGAGNFVPGCQRIDTSTCADYCGDGAVEAGFEVCDGLDQAGATCAGFGARGPLDCSSRCSPTFERCQFGRWTAVVPQLAAAAIVAAWSPSSADVWYLVADGAVTRARRFVEGAWVALADAPDTAVAITGLGDTVVIAGDDAPAAGSDEWLWQWSRATGAWVPFRPRIPAYTSETITALWMPAAGELWAVSSLGRAFHLSGGAWTAVDVTHGGGALDAIHGAGGLVVAGGAGLYDLSNLGNVWGVRFPNTIRDVFVRSPDDAWAVDSAGTIFHLPDPRHITCTQPDDFCWDPSVVQSPPEGGPLTGVVASAAEDAWLVGASGTGPGAAGLLFHIDGTVDGNTHLVAALLPSTAVPALGALAGDDTGNLWAAAGTSFERWDGGQWHGVLRPTLEPGYGLPLTSTDFVAVAAADDAVWLGGRSSGSGAFVPLVRYARTLGVTDPAQWTDQTPPGLAGNVTAVWARGRDDAWVFTDAGDVRHWNGAAWSAMSLPAVTSVWGVGAELYAATGATGLLHFDGVHFDASGWSALPPAPIGAPAVVAGSGPSDVWVAAGARVAEWDGQAWHDRGARAFTVRALWAASPYAAVAGGGTGLARWDGAGWADAGPAVTLASIQGLVGTSAHDVWAVGTAGSGGLANAALHWDGSRWTEIPLGDAPPLHAAAATPGGELWAVGDALLTDPATLLSLQRLDQRPAAVTAGACAGAAPIGCATAATLLTGAADAGAPAEYVIDAPFTTTLALTVTPTGGGPLAISVRERGADGACDPDHPLATATASAATVALPPVAMTVGHRYYVEIAAPGAAGFELGSLCGRP